MKTDEELALRSREELEAEARRLATDVLEGAPGAIEALERTEVALLVEKRLAEARQHRSRQQQWEREAPQREAEQRRAQQARAEKEQLAAGVEDYVEVFRLLNVVDAYVASLDTAEREDRRRRFAAVVEEVRRKHNIDSRASLLVAAERAPQLAAVALVEEARPLQGSPGRDGKTALETSTYGMRLVDALRRTAEALRIEVPNG